VVISSFDVYAFVAAWSTPALERVPDPATDEGWTEWEKHGWKGDRPLAIERYDPAGETRHNADFMLEHWQVVSTAERQQQARTVRLSCDAFDRETRLCTAHADRPPICYLFPYYGGDVLRWNARGTTNPGGEAHCSYWLDVPPVDRPQGSRPLIPVTVL
jgi:hypothetical protein